MTRRQNFENLESWAILNGFNPETDYAVADEPMAHDAAPLPPGYLSPHFREAEFACNHCGELPADKRPPKQLLDWLETIRAEYNSPVIINSGYRCPTHNANVGGARHSRHLQGDAADFYIKGVDPGITYALADELIGSHGGVGKYSGFTHIDARGSYARW